jgi:hypothetical protein
VTKTGKFQFRKKIIIQFEHVTFLHSLSGTLDWHPQDYILKICFFATTQMHVCLFKPTGPAGGPQQQPIDLWGIY